MENVQSQIKTKIMVNVHKKILVVYDTTINIF